MARRLGVLTAIVVVLALLVVSSVYNLRQRRLALEKARSTEVTLTKAPAPGADEDSAEPDAQGAALQGKAAPAFSLTDLSGKQISLAQFKGHPVVVNFWATWCGPCKLEMPWFESAYNKYKPQGLVILGLSQDDGTSKDKIAAAARRLLDKEGAEAVTMRRVAGAVGITPMAIYRHFPDRAGLLNAVADRGVEELAARLKRMRFNGSVEQRLAKMGEIYLDHALENPRLFELMFLKPRQGARRYPRDFKAGRSPTANLMVEALREGMNDGLFRKGDPWEIVFEMGALSHGLILLYLGGRMDATPTQFRALYRRSFRRYVHALCN